MSAKQSGNVRAGEAGHQGHDRQPAKDGVTKTTAPEASEAATAAEVAARSKEATDTQSKRSQTPDIAHPGPNRMEAEKSKGDAHHDQHEHEKDMQNKVEKL